MKRLVERPPHLESIRILGVRIDNITLSETLALIETMIAAGGPHQIATVNPEFVMAAQANRPFHATLESTILAVPDGIGIIKAAAWQGKSLRERVTGVDLTLAIAEASARLGWRIFLLGAAEGVADKAAAVLRERFPATKIVGTWAGSPRHEDFPAIAEQIRAVTPDIVLVAYGAPAQDLWIRRYGAALRIPVGIGIGGTLDYLAGVQPRAPRMVRDFGLEWLHRLITQPRRWRRIVTAVGQFGWAAWREARQTDGTTNR